MKLLIKISILITIIISTANASLFKLAMSSDGKYVIATDNSNNAFLFNIDSKEVNKVNKKAVNIYSPNFINNTHNFIYQNDEDNIVSIVDADNMKTIKTFDPKSKSYGQAINQDMTRYASTQKNQLMLIMSMINGKGKVSGRPTPYGTWQPTFSFDQQKIFATSSYDGEFFIWDSKNGNKIADIVKNVGQTMNAIDPSGEFVYTMSERIGTKYNLDNGSTPEMTGFYGTSKIEDVTYLKSNLRKSSVMGDITNFKFIDKDKIIVTFTGINQPYLWAFFYTPSKLDWSVKNDIRPIFESNEYSPLVENPLDFATGDYRGNTEPYPVTGGFNTNFDTSVEAHRLVMAQANGDGIMVYKYNPSDESLKLEWMGEVK